LLVVGEDTANDQTRAQHVDCTTDGVDDYNAVTSIMNDASEL
jgi:hypothetical protein